MSQYVSNSDKKKNLHLKSTEVLLQIIQKNSHKIVITFKLMIKKIFVRNCCSNNNLIDNFKSTDLILLNHFIFLKNTVIEKNLIKLNKSIDKKRSDLLTDNFHYSSSNKHMKNTQKCTHIFKRADSDSIL